MRYRFGDLLFDTATRELARRGEAVPLPLKTFRLLEILIEARPRALSKDELHALVWPGLYVSEASLTRLVSDLREALGCPEGERCEPIRTVHGFGYAFVAEVTTDEPASPGASCHLVWGRRLVPLAAGENLLGRDGRSIVPFDSPKVSRRHARIVVAGDGALLEDLGSKNGTYLQGVRIAGPAPLADGDSIVIGAVTLVFRRSTTSPTTETELSGLHREVPS
jgi:DNA-binding winged helix-turn-helix (wHTH) protein